MEKSNYHSNADHHKRHMKQSVEKRAFLCAFIISFTVCTLFFGVETGFRIGGNTDTAHPCNSYRQQH